MKKFAILLLTVYALSFAQELGARYLIITHDNFYDAIQPLAQWKHKKGMRTKVTKLSEIGATQVQIKNYIIEAYNNWQIKPEFLLLVGAPNFIPFPQISGTYTDNYYTNMDGDIYNEILSGRLTVHNTTEAQTVVDKILLYERTPHMTDSSWFKKTCLIARMGGDADDSIYWSDVHHAASLLIDNGYIEIDTLSNLYGDTKDSVVNAVNNGRSIVMYRGTAFNNWYTPFDVNADLTTNGEKLPIVLSTTCRTVGTSSTPAAAEKWFLTGTPTLPRGASGYFTTTTAVINQAYLRSAVAKGWFDAVFIENKRTFGEACEAGRKRVYQMYPYLGGDEEYYGFTTVGDPEMNIWTATPQFITVVHNPSLHVGDDTLHMYVAHPGTPVESALVCVVLDTTIYETGYTGADGTIDFPLVISDLGNVDVTITGKNIYPSEMTIPILNDDVYLVYDHHTFSDSLGNNNGVVDNGETILLWVFIKNLGTPLAHNVSATIRCNDTTIVLIDSISHYGNIPALMTNSGSNPYVFSVSPFSQNHTVNFELVIVSETNTWYDDFSLYINGTGIETSPWLYITNYAVHDSIAGNNNGIIEPGEAIDICIVIKNGGDTKAINVTGTLRSIDLGVEIADSTTSFGDIAVGSTAHNLDDAFIVGINTIPDDSTFGFVLYLSCNGGEYHKQDYFTVYSDGLTGSEENNLLDYKYGLEVYPNPFREEIKIHPNMGHSVKCTELKIYDVTGRLIKDFSLPTTYSLLPTSITWDGTDNRGHRVSEGIYFLRSTTESVDAIHVTQTEKVILLK